ncbi:hypothetical protein Kpho02_75500 [Kitasatospora phosalacinea]|uniref:Uncharacterized protein n=1 Tax=Kitasatospora phosalacinea TaxID=2065 RepID=A0A9W6QHX4_9ACTN|nr:hypothetical protein Kpho02_75500 [Kitasatospora phosalacinea]
MADIVLPPRPARRRRRAPRRQFGSAVRIPDAAAGRSPAGSGYLGTAGTGVSLRIASKTALDLASSHLTADSPVGVR